MKYLFSFLSEFLVFMLIILMIWGVDTCWCNSNCQKKTREVWSK